MSVATIGAFGISSYSEGRINLHKVSEVKLKSLFKDSKLNKILKMVQDATARKSQTQLFISRFAKIIHL
jgi:Cd2+/Zn2+-exporting ATPase